MLVRSEIDVERKLVRNEELIAIAKEWKQEFSRNAKGHTSLIADFAITSVLMAETLSEVEHFTWEQRGQILLNEKKAEALYEVCPAWLNNRLALLYDMPVVISSEVLIPLGLAALSLDGRIITHEGK